MLTDPGANARLEPRDVPGDEIRTGGHLHVSGYALLRAGSRPAAVAALAAAGEAGVAASVDPASTAPLAEVGRDAFLGMALGAGTIIATRDEAEVLTGSREPEVATPRLLQGRDEVVLKLGGEGAVWAGADGGVVRVPGGGSARPRHRQHRRRRRVRGGVARRPSRGVRPRAALEAACGLAARVVARPGARP